MTPRDVWDFVAGGSGDELTLRRNRSALDAVTLLPRVLAGGAEQCTRTAVPGGQSAMPVAVAPMAYQRLLHPDGELAAAAAARAAGVPFVASTLSSYTIEQIAAVGATTWFQLYWLRDRAAVADLVRRAEACGCAALMLTVDVPEMGRRLRDVHNGFGLPDWICAANLAADGPSEAHLVQEGRSAVAAHTSASFDPAVSWSDLGSLRALTTLPLVVKGILDPRDARRAADIGVDAIVVSNHGGRQLDGAAAAIRAVPEVVAEVGDSCRVMVDSGFRSGMDVLRALALGASAVLLGRPVLWGLAVGGERGVLDVLTMVGDELRHAMRLSGCHTPADARDLRVLWAD